MTVSENKNRTLVAVVGPTASGKTSAAIEIARHFKTEIISFDSRQFYRGMDIGTAKPTTEELQSAPHHFISHLDVTERYTAGMFANDAEALLRKLLESNDLVVAAGGSGLFLKAWTEGLDVLPDVDETIRIGLQKQLKEKGIVALQQLLKELDPAYHSVVDLNNPRRLVRALEVCIASALPYSSFLTRTTRPLDYRLVKIGLLPSREDLYRVIDSRVDAMIENGLVDEVRALLPYRDLKPLQTVGYSELFDYFDGKTNLPAAIEKIKQHSRNYAKRQITWFKKDKSVVWFEKFNLAEAVNVIAKTAQA